MYKIKDLKGILIEGKFYEDQLQKIKIDGNRPLKVIKTRGLGTSLQYFIETANKKNKWISREQYLSTKI